MRRILFFAYTPFQAIASLAIRDQFYADCSADIIIPESVQNRDRMRNNIYKFGLFDSVYFANIRTFFPKSANRIRHEYNRIKSSVSPYYLARDIGIDKPLYDVFITTEVNYYTESIFSLLRRYNPEIQAELMDEGYSSYTYYFKEAYLPCSFKRRVRNTLFKIPGKCYRRRFIANEAKLIYYFAPELLCWDDIPYEIKKINVKNNPVFFQRINQLFDYEELRESGLEEEYSRPFLYFEESFFWSRKNNKDVKIIDHIAGIVGKDSMAIKLHPRNEINRFEKQGYKTNKTYGVPWELVAVNLKDDDKRVFLSFSSGAVLNYKFISDKSFKTILLYKCIGDEFYHVDDDVMEWFEKFKAHYGDSVYIPSTIEELDDLLVELSAKGM